ncbi:adenosylcobinamide-GDP ribazoletransferase, partial [Kineosporia sp. A_224]|uniref:adenosylcobinamide-GDP ribazoletransferase n=1 Tax=Kineosporia sp. A_224 TaxID=1962180 RepID=UPI00117B3C6E
MPQRGRFDGARLAVGTLTVLRVPAPGVVDARSARTAMLLAPLAGLLPATGAAVVVAAVQALGISLLVAALLALGAAALLTRGLHLDGLADTADGLAAAYDRTKALDVMRRGDVGPAGAVTLVLVVGVQAAALAQAAAQVVAHAGGPGTVRAAVALGVVVLVGLGAGRVTLPLACSRGVRAARPGGLGAAVAGSVPVPGTVLV